MDHIFSALSTPGVIDSIHRCDLLQHDSVPFECSAKHSFIVFYSGSCSDLVCILSLKLYGGIEMRLVDFEFCILQRCA